MRAPQVKPGACLQAHSFSVTEIEKLFRAFDHRRRSLSSLLNVLFGKVNLTLADAYVVHL